MYDTISNNITFKGPNGTTQTFQNICEPFCGINEMLIKGLTTPTFLVDRYYPIFKIIVYDVNIGKFIFKRSQDEHGRLTGSKLMVFYYTTFVDSDEKKLQLDELDHKVVEYVYEQKLLTIDPENQGFNGVIFYHIFAASVNP
uniref:Uncharacterized protein n=1 Tax=Panagrolaimus davidi TaxID=227884 RepID=A0A914PM68_9BILA